MISTTLLSGIAPKAIVAFVIAGMGFWLGYRLADHWGKQALSEAVAEHQTQIAEIERQAHQQLIDQMNRGNAVAKQLTDERNNIQATSRRLREELRHAQTKYKETSDSTPVDLPGLVVTRGWVCDVNAAFGADAQSAGPGNTVAKTCSADPATRAAVDRQDLDAWLIDIGEQYREQRAQINALIDYIELADTSMGDSQ